MNKAIEFWNQADFRQHLTGATVISASVYIAGAALTEKKYDVDAQRLRHSALGIFKELGELAGEINRVVHYGKELTPELLDNFAEECGDVYFFVAIPHNIYVTTFDSTPASLYHPEISNLRFLEMWALDAQIMSADYTRAVLMHANKAEILARATRILRHLEVLLKRFGYEPSVVMLQNNRKLLTGPKARYSDGSFSAEQAEARADKDGLSHKES